MTQFYFFIYLIKTITVFPTIKKGWSELSNIIIVFKKQCILTIEFISFI